MGAAVSAEDGSFGSWPASPFRSSAASSTVRAIGPTWSSVQEMGTIPYVLTRPRVGFSPTTPQRIAGDRIEPDVSPPVAPSTIWAATAAAEPPLDPPGSWERSQGFLVPGVDPPKDHSGRLVFPTMIAPAALSRATTVASKGGVKPARIGERAVVGRSTV